MKLPQKETIRKKKIKEKARKKLLKWQVYKYAHERAKTNGSKNSNNKEPCQTKKANPILSRLKAAGQNNNNKNNT